MTKWPETDFGQFFLVRQITTQTPGNSDKDSPHMIQMTITFPMTETTTMIENTRFQNISAVLIELKVLKVKEHY